MIWQFISNVAGNGGGGTIIPIIREIFNFNLKDSISISNFTIAVSALTRFLLNSQRKDPVKVDLEGKPTGVLVDYSLSVLLAPMVIVGATIGAIVQ